MTKAKKPGKATKAPLLDLSPQPAVDERRREVETMMVNCVRRSNIVAAIGKKYGARPGTVDDDIRAVRDAWTLRAKGETTESRREALRETVRGGYASAAAARSFSGMGKFAELMGKLDGLFTENHKVEAGESLASLMAACVKPKE